MSDVGLACEFLFTNRCFFFSSSFLLHIFLDPVPLHISHFSILPSPLPHLCHTSPPSPPPPPPPSLPPPPPPTSSRRHTESSRDGCTMTLCTTWMSPTSSLEMGCHCGCGEERWKFRQHTQQSLPDCGTKGTPCSEVWS